MQAIISSGSIFHLNRKSVLLLLESQPPRILICLVLILLRNIEVYSWTLRIKA